jgi:hypothetical protein
VVPDGESGDVHELRRAPQLIRCCCFQSRRGGDIGGIQGADPTQPPVALRHGLAELLRPLPRTVSRNDVRELLAVALECDGLDDVLALHEPQARLASAEARVAAVNAHHHRVTIRGGPLPVLPVLDGGLGTQLIEAGAHLDVVPPGELALPVQGFALCCRGAPVAGLPHPVDGDRRVLYFLGGAERAIVVEASGVVPCPQAVGGGQRRQGHPQVPVGLGLEMRPQGVLHYGGIDPVPGCAVCGAAPRQGRHQRHPRGVPREPDTVELQCVTDDLHAGEDAAAAELPGCLCEDDGVPLPQDRGTVDLEVTVGGFDGRGEPSRS